MKQKFITSPTLLLILWLLSFSQCEPLIREETIKALKEEVTWEVAELHENTLKDYDKETFKRRLLNHIPVELRNAADDKERNSRMLNYAGDLEDTLLQGRTKPLPKTFSWATEWPECIHSGRDQGSDCGSCWAFALINHLSDRFCMWGKDVELSTQHLLECDTRSKCCDGGTDMNGYKFFMENGVVSEQCRPYDIKCNSCRKVNCPVYKCRPGSDFYTSDREKAKREIYYNGPIQGIFSVYDDFTNYKSGVYYHKKGEFLGIHTVEILGWGVENNMAYWLCKNCWGDDWGMRSLFKIRMGDCGIDDYLSTCLPLV